MKYHPHRSVLFVTFSVEEGLLLLCNPLCETIIKGCLARAQHLYRVRICHFLVEATHIHMLFVVENPADIPSFLRHFKTESAHLLNSLLGREKRTVWCDGYDSPIVLTPLRALLAIVYLYSNPAKDNLEESIERYPGFSSWSMYQKSKLTHHWPRIRRTMVRPLPPDSQNLRGYTKEAEHLLRKAQTKHVFLLEPNAWLEAFDITDSVEQARLNAVILERLRRVEKRAQQKRQLTKKRIIGATALTRQVFNLYYRPRRGGKRMWCLSESRKIRVRFIRFFRELMNRAREIRSMWNRGDFSLPYPLGLYPPCLPKLAEPLGAW